MFTYLLVLLVGSSAFRNAYAQGSAQLGPQPPGTETLPQSPYQAQTPGSPGYGKDAEYEEISGNEIDNEYKEADFQDNRLRLMLQPKKSVALNATSVKTWGAAQGTSRKSMSPKPNGTSRRAMDHTPERENLFHPNVLQALPEIGVPERKTIEVNAMVKKSSTGQAQAKAISIADTSDIASEKSQGGNEKSDNISVFASGSPNGKQIVIESPNASDNNLSQVNGLSLAGFPNNFVENFVSSNKTLAKPLEVLDSLNNVAEFSNNSETEALASVPIKKDTVKSNVTHNEDEKSKQNQADAQQEKDDKEGNQNQVDTPNEEDGEKPNQVQTDTPKEKDEKLNQNKTDAPKEDDKKPNQTEADIPKEKDGEKPNQTQADIPKEKDGEKPNQTQTDIPKEKDEKLNQTQADTPKEKDGKKPNQTQEDTPKETDEKLNQNKTDAPKEDDEKPNQTQEDTPKEKDDEKQNQIQEDTLKEKDDKEGNQTQEDTPKEKDDEKQNQIQEDTLKEKDDKEGNQNQVDTPKEKDDEKLNQTQADIPKEKDEKLNQTQADIPKEKDDEKPNQPQVDTSKETAEKLNQTQTDAPKQSYQKIIPDTQKSLEKPNIYNPAPLTAGTGKEISNTNQIDDLQSVNTQEMPELHDSSEEEPCNGTSKENDVFYEELEPDPTFVEDEIEYAIPQVVNDTKSGAVIIVLPGSGSDQIDMNEPQTDVVPQNMLGSDRMAKSIFHLLVNLTAINAINERNGRKILEELDKQKANLHHLRKQSDAVYHYITNMKNN